MKFEKNRSVDRFWVLSFLLAGLPLNLSANEEKAAHEMVVAAQRLLGSLDAKQLAMVRIPFGEEERENFHYIPRERKGISFKELRSEQQMLATALLSSGLSHIGYTKVSTIMSLEPILYETARGDIRRWRDAELYFFSIFGLPRVGGTWGWRFEGHHVSLNFSIIEGKHISATPSFLGSNPARVRSGARAGLQVLADEEMLGRQLAKSLSAEQQGMAFFSSDAPRDIITGAERRVSPLEPQGIAWTALNQNQQRSLRRLIDSYLHRHRNEVAEADLARIESSGWNQVHFAWAGSTEPGQGHYYRIQGPTFLLEYDNTQNGANHVHAVYRDFAEDFGRDLLKEHYQRDHRQ